MTADDTADTLDRGIHRVRSPEATCDDVLARLGALDPPILERYYTVETPAGIPQYRVRGTRRYVDTVKARGSNGKGHTWPQAMASGLMELVERWSCKGHLVGLRGARRCTADDLPDEPYSFDDMFSCFLDPPERLLSEDELRTTTLTWFDGHTLDGRSVHLPELVNRTVGHGQATNGMAAGTTFDEALLQAVCEVVERHCDSLVRYRALPTPRIDPRTVDSPLLRDLMARFEALGQTIQLRDYSLDTGLPVFGVVRRLSDGMVQLNVGVAPWRDEALARALTESSQSEHSPHSMPAGEGDFLFDHDGSKSFADMPSLDGGEVSDEMDRFVTQFDRLGWTVHYIDATDPALEIPAAIVDITGTQYHMPGKLSRSDIAAIISDAFIAGDFTVVDRLIGLGLDRDAGHAAIYCYYRGQLRLRRGEHREAMDDLKVVVDEFADHPRSDLPDEARLLALRAARAIGHCYRALGDSGSAIEWYARVWPAVVRD